MKERVICLWCFGRLAFYNFLEGVRMPNWEYCEIVFSGASNQCCLTITSEGEKTRLNTSEDCDRWQLSKEASETQVGSEMGIASLLELKLDLEKVGANIKTLIGKTIMHFGEKGWELAGARKDVYILRRDPSQVG